MIRPETVETYIINKFIVELEALDINIPVVNFVRGSTECLFVTAHRELGDRFDNINLEYTMVVDVKYTAPLNIFSDERKDDIENMIVRTMVFDDCWIYGGVPGLVNNNVEDYDLKYNEENEDYYLHKKFNLTIIGE